MRPLGVSENIAQAGGPSGAHEGWCHSSGHHRNLLAAGWKLLGVGNAGHTWCQNFSAGEEKPPEAAPETAAKTSSPDLPDSRLRPPAYPARSAGSRPQASARLVSQGRSRRSGATRR